MDTDGRREDSRKGGEGVTGATTRVPPRVDGRLARISANAFGGAYSGLRWALGDKRGQRIRQGALPDLMGASWRGCSIVRWMAQTPALPSVRKWNRSQPCQGQRCGRCRVRRRAERVIRPTRAKNRRRRVLVDHLLTQTDARRPASEVVGQHLDGQPRTIGSEAP